MIFEAANKSDLDGVYALYQAAIGGEFCTWDEEYPGWEQIRRDFAGGGLYVLRDGETLAGALSVLPENEMDGFDCWAIRQGAQEIGRITVAQAYRGHGLAGRMVGEAMDRLQALGRSAIHLSTPTINLPAQKTYAKLGFTVVGEREMYGGKFFLLEKIL